MNNSRNFFRNTTNLDSFDEKLFRNEATKPNFSFMSNNSNINQRRTSKADSPVGDGTDRCNANCPCPFASLDKTEQSGKQSEKDPFYTGRRSMMSSSHKWQPPMKTFKPNVEAEEEDDNEEGDKVVYKSNDYLHKIPKLGTDFSVHSTQSTPSASITKEYLNEDDYTASDVPHGDQLDKFSSDIDDPSFINSPHTTLKSVKSFEKTSSPLSDDSGINILMLFALVVAMIGSKGLQYLLVYMEWFREQINQLRSAFLDDANAWEILDFDTTARFNLRSKIVLAPILICCGLLNGIVGLMHFAIKVFLAPAPEGLTKIVQKLGICPTQQHFY